VAARKPVNGSRVGTNARPADEGYLYVAGVRDASQRVSEFRVRRLFSYIDLLT